MRFHPKLLLLLICPAIYAQQSAPPGQPTDPSAWSTKTIELKYIDPEQLRSLYAGQSYVMEANRELKVLKVNGPQSFLQEVEDAGKRLDVPPPAPANIQVTVYLLATAAQAPSAAELPADLKTIDASLKGLASSQSLRLADSQVLRLREGQPGELRLTDSKAAGGPALTRIRVQAAVAGTDPKANRISLDGVRCWVTKPAGQPNTPAPMPAGDGDFVANIDLVPNQPAVLAEAGTEKPLVLAVRATVIR